MKTRKTVLVYSVFLALLFLLPVFAFPQAPVYQGKTITIIQGRSPGGTGDMYVRSIMPFLQKYIPGNPAIVTEYMEGGGSRRAANHIFAVAHPDGLTIGNVSAGMVSLAILGETGIKYDLHKFVYLGSTYSTVHPIFVTRKEAGLDSLEKLRAASGVRIGDQSVGFATYNEGRLFAYLLGLKEPRFVVGYSGREVDLALIRGEVDARTNLAATLLNRNPEWIDQGLVNVHAIIEVPKGEKHPRFAHLPELETFARSETERKLIALLRIFRLVGAPFILPPDTPKDRVEILREAMRKTFKDPEFPSQYKKLIGDEPSPLMPEAQDEAIKKIPREPEIIELLKKIVGAGPLPPR